MSRYFTRTILLCYMLVMVKIAVAQSSPYHWGPISWNPRLQFEYTLKYATGIQSRPGHPTSADSQSFSSPVRIDLGRYWLLNYTPTWHYYSNPEFNDSLDHRMLLVGKYTAGAWSTQAEVNYSAAESISTETGGQEKQDAYSASLSAAHRFGPNLVGQLSAGETIRSAQEGSQAQLSSLFGLMDYSLTSSLGAGLGFSAAYETSDINPHAYIYRPEMQMRWRLSKRTSMLSSFGWEKRQSLGAKALDLTTPSFSAAVDFKPFKQTGLSLGVKRTSSSSVFAKRASDGLGWTAKLNQRLLGRLNFSMGATDEETNYVATTQDGPPPRKDRLRDYTAGLGISILKQGAIGITYSHRRNASTEPGFSFVSREAGLTVTYAFEGRPAPREIE